MASSSVTPTKTVFTADVVTYDFLPEKYAESKAIVTAELNLEIACDWQTAVNTWWTSAATKLYPGVAGVDVPCRSDLMEAHYLASQDSSYTQSATDIAPATNGSTALPSQVESRQAVQQMLHEILTSCDTSAGGPGGPDASYFVGDATAFSDTTSVSAQLKQTLTALLAVGTSQNSQNSLEIDEDKVKADLGGAGVKFDEIPVVQAPTAKLQKLVNANAFVPVLNRLIAAGAFSKGAMGSATTGEDGVRRFDLGTDADSASTDLLEATSQLVFPVRIQFADDSQTQTETDGLTGASNETGAAVVFQLNIIIQKTA